MTAWFVAGLIAAFAVSFADEAAIRFVRGFGFGRHPLHGLHHQYRPLAMVSGAGRAGVPARSACPTGRAAARAPRRAFPSLFGQAAYVFSSVALSGLFVNAIKVLFGRARPRLLDQLGAHYFDPLTFGYLNASFPSGHSTTVGAIVGILIIWYPRWSLLIIELGLFFAATRIAAQAHYPSDVVTGFLSALFFSIAPGALACQARRRFSLRARENPSRCGGALADKKIPAVVTHRNLRLPGWCVAGLVGDLLGLDHLDDLGTSSDRAWCRGCECAMSAGPAPPGSAARHARAARSGTGTRNRRSSRNGAARHRHWALPSSR